MCGIFCSVSRECFIRPGDRLKKSLNQRGPDSLREQSVTLDASSADVQTSHLTFLSTVLALRGDYLQEQPLSDEATRSVFCWNGEAWKVNGFTVQGNDSLHVFRTLLRASETQGNDDHILNVLNNISGPFAFVFYDAAGQKLYYGRDRLGRRSLLRRQDAPGSLVLCSVTDTVDGDWLELSYDGIYILDLANDAGDARLIPWKHPFEPINPAVPVTQVAHLETAAPSIDLLRNHLFESIQYRVADIASLGSFGQSALVGMPAKVAILFSGGLDCTVLARIAHDILELSESIDLLNVAFENPRSVAAAKSNPSFDAYEACPDRITGRRSFEELLKACPGRTIRFVAIDVPYAESQSHRSKVINLMYPHNTEMDLSIAMALYFASRGMGTVKDKSGDVSPYITPARVLLSGLGADELFGGYTRHATAFARKGYPGLISELSLDITRLGSRNLGRDDRIISQWGKEARFPYLDEDFVRWVLQMPVWEKCGFGEEDALAQEIEPAKKALRLLAHKMDLPGVAKEKKRAIQFGAKTAKMETGGGRTKGTDTLTRTNDTS